MNEPIRHHHGWPLLGTLLVLACSGGGGDGDAGVASDIGPLREHAEVLTLPGATGAEPDGRIPTCCKPAEADEAELQSLLQIVNTYRRAKGIVELSYDPSLEQAASGHAHHMAVHPFYSDTAPELAIQSPMDRAPKCGATANAETVARNLATATEVMNTWKANSGSNANLTNKTYSRVGFGRYPGPTGYLWVALFGQ